MNFASYLQVMFYGLVDAGAKGSKLRNVIFFIFEKIALKVLLL